VGLFCDAYYKMGKPTNYLLNLFFKIGPLQQDVQSLLAISSLLARFLIILFIFSPKRRVFLIQFI
jgi:hypothetical protein